MDIQVYYGYNYEIKLPNVSTLVEREKRPTYNGTPFRVVTVLGCNITHINQGVIT